MNSTERYYLRLSVGACALCGGKKESAEHVYCNKCKEKESNRKRATKQLRKAMGLCTQCGKNEVDEGYSTCSACRAKNRKDKKADRDYKISHGICPRCGKYEIFGDEKACPECRAKKCEESARHRQKRTAADRKRINEVQKKRVNEKVKQGYCGRCLRRKALVGLKSCAICRQKYLDAYEPKRIELKKQRLEERSYRIDNHLCVRCGDPALDGYKLCERHYNAVLRSKNHPNSIAYREAVKKNFRYGKELRNAEGL